MNQTRIDLAYLGSFVIATRAESLTDRSKLPSHLQARQQCYKMIWSRNVAIWYRDFPLSASDRPLQLLAFADAGYKSLPRSGSVECYYICLGNPIQRDGVILSAAHPVHWSTRRIKRCVRSPLAAEAVDLATALGNAMWFQAVYYVLWNVAFLYSPFNNLRDMPLITPFRVSSDSSEVLTPHCRDCNFSEDIPLATLREGHRTLYHASDNAGGEVQVRILASTDCANAYSATFASNHRGDDKITRLHLCFARDGLHLYNISYPSSGFNLADTGAKVRGNIHLIDEMLLNNRCRVGFLSREEMKTLLHHHSSSMPRNSPSRRYDVASA